MIFGINKNDSTPKTAMKAGIAGATVGAGAIAMSKIRPAMKEAFNDSIKQQKGYIEKFDKYVSKKSEWKDLDPLQKINEYMTRRFNTTKITPRKIHDTFKIHESEIDAPKTENFKNFLRGSEEIIEKGSKNVAKEIAEEGEVLLKGKPSKYIAGKKAIGKTAAKIGSKFEKMGDAIYKFIKSDAKKAMLKENKGKITGSLKKYGLPILIATAAAASAATVAKTIINKQKAKDKD